AALGAAAGLRQRHASQVIDELGIDMLGATEDAQARPFRAAHNAAAHMLPPPELPPMFRLLLVHDYRTLKLTTAGEGLAFLAPHLFIFVAYPLALVGFRLARGADLGRELAHLLF